MIWWKGLFGAVLVLFALYGIRLASPPPMVCPPPKVVFKPVPPMGSPYEMEVIRLTNQYRSRHGLPPLKPDLEMMKFSRNWSARMANGRMVHSKGPYGENIAKGYATPEAAVKAWYLSPGHRKNMLSSRYTYIGAGQVLNSWTQVMK